VRQIPDLATRELYVNRLAERFRVSRSAVLEPRREHVRSSRSRSRDSSLSERLVAMAVQGPELARVAREMGIAECVDDEHQKHLAEAAIELCDQPGFGAAMVLDRIEDDGEKKLVAGWTFSEQQLLPPEEYRIWAGRLRAGWLVERIRVAQEQGREDEVERLTRERSQLLSSAARDRSNRK
jgi:hypothetical protein